MIRAMSAGPLLQIDGLTKMFPGVRALDDVCLRVETGAVHALMGENGAGKSTLMRILAGMDSADGGIIRFKGGVFAPRHPREALASGVSMIHQELLPFLEMTVAENIFMGREPLRNRLGWIDRDRMVRGASSLLGRVGAAIAPSRRMGDLGVADMQLVEIAKALGHRSELLIMDEPTSALSSREIDALFHVIFELKASGVAVIYISHRLDEVFRIAGHITVLRDGRVTGSARAGALDEAKLISMMVGRELRRVDRRRSRVGEPILEVRELGRRGKFEGVSFTVRRGEIVAIAGLMGAGRTEVLHAISGLTPADSGQLLIRGIAARIASPRAALRLGIAMVSEDRKREGLIGGMSVKDNLTLASLRGYCRGPLIDARSERRVADEQMAALNIRAPHRDTRVELLSGGNQQKVALGKALLAAPEILLLDEPTRGIDVAAKAEVHDIIRRLASEGKAIIVVSSEMPEVFALGDRILVMRAGRLVGQLDAREATEEGVMSLAMRN